MTVESSINRSGPFIASGPSGVFPRNFLLFNPAHLRVVRVRDGLESEITTGITHSGLGSTNGTVAIAGGMQAGDRITLIRAVPHVQRSNYSAQSSVPADQVELDLDLIQMQVQDLAERLRRALTLPVDSMMSGDDAMRAALDAPQYAAQAMAAALQADAAAVMSLGVPQYATRAAAQAATVSAQAAQIIVGGLSYRRDSSGMALTTAGGQRWSPSGQVTFRHFGAQGDGSAEDAASIVSAVNYASSKGETVDGEGLTFRLADTVSLPSNRRVKIRNATFDGTSIQTNGLFTTPVLQMLCAAPIAIGPIALDVFVNSNQASMVSVAGLDAGDYVLLTSQKKMAETEVEGQTSRHSRAAELLRVKSITGTTVTFWSRSKDRYNVSDTSVLYKVQTSGSVDFEGVTIVGGDVGLLVQDGFESRYRGCTLINQAARGINEDRCYRTDGDGWIFQSQATEPAFTANAAYGISFTGCQNCSYGSVRSDRLRHTVTTGSNGSSRGRYVSRGCTLGDVYATNSFSSVVDQHPGGGFLQVGNVYAEFAENASHLVACQFQGAGGQVKSIHSNNGWGFLFDSYGFMQDGFNPVVLVGSMICTGCEYGISISNYSNRYGTGSTQKIIANIASLNIVCGTAFSINHSGGNVELTVGGGQISCLSSFGAGLGGVTSSSTWLARIRLSNLDIQVPGGSIIMDLRKSDISIAGGSLRGSGGNAIFRMNDGSARLVGVLEDNIVTDLTGGAILQRASMA